MHRTGEKGQLTGHRQGIGDVIGRAGALFPAHSGEGKIFWVVTPVPLPGVAAPVARSGQAATRLSCSRQHNVRGDAYTVRTFSDQPGE